MPQEQARTCPGGASTRTYRTALGAVIAGGGLYRLWFLYATQWTIEGDEAAVGLQALNILRGERPIFYPGQSYLGNLESYLVALSFSLFEVSRFSVKLVPFIFALAFIYLCAVIGRELGGDGKAGLMAALAAAFPPVYLAMWSIKARGGYIEALVIAQLAFLWMFRWHRRLVTRESAAPGEGGSPIAAGAIFGFLCGYGIWLNPLVIYLLLPMSVAGLVLLPGIARFWRKNLASVLAAMGGALAGFLPLILFRAAYGREVLARIEENVPPTDAWQPLAKKVWFYFWQDGLPTLAGLRPPREAFVPDWRLIVIPLYIAAGVYLFWRARKSIPLLVLALMVVLTFPIFVLGSLTGGNFAVIIPDSGLLTRFLFPLYLPIAIGLGLVLARIPLPLRAISIVVLGAANLIGALTANVAWLAQNEFCNQALPLSNRELVDLLERHSLNYVYTNHWIGYPLMVESRERIVTFDYSDVKFGMDRFPNYSEQVARAERAALVVFNPHYDATPIDDELARLSIAFHKEELDGYIVYYDFAPSVHPSMLGAVLKWPYY